MSRHLDADQMAEWMAGERHTKLEDHLRACTECRLALEETRTALGGWRDAVRTWSDREYQLAQQRAAERPSASNASTLWTAMRWYCAGAATVACALIVLLGWHNGAAPASMQQDPTSSLAVSSAATNRHGVNPDAVLMRQVDREVSQTVPNAMAPLIALVSWDSEPVGEGTAARQESSKQAE